MQIKTEMRCNKKSKRHLIKFHTPHVMSLSNHTEIEIDEEFAGIERVSFIYHPDTNSNCDVLPKKFL